MKARLLLSLTSGGLILASLMVLSTTAVHAQCGGPNEPPCPKPGEKEKKPTPIPPTETPQPCTESAWYQDLDADGYGVPGTTTYACSAPAGYAAALADCNDTNAAIHPGATNICGNGLDEDCSGADAVCAVAAPAPANEACVGPDCAPAGGGFPSNLGGGLTGILIGLLVGILIGLLVPAVAKSFFDRGGGVFKPRAGGGPHVASSDDPAGFDVFTPNPAGGGGTDPAGSFFDSPAGKGTPGGGDTDPAGSFFDSPAAQAPGPPDSPAGSFFDSNPALRAREAALNAREAALNAREAALNARGAGGGPKSGFDTDM